MRSARGFSLTELLVVIGILVLLAALLFPVFSRAKARGKLEDCKGRLRQAALGLHLYRVDHDGHGWLLITDRSGGHTTAGRYRYPWNTWQPGEPYIKDGRLVWCPEPPRDMTSVYNQFHYRAVSRPSETPGEVRVRYPMEPEAGRVVAYCANHATNELEFERPKRSGYSDIWKGTYTAVREDGGTATYTSRQITPWFLWQDGTWHDQEHDKQQSMQAWRFEGEPWPPVTPFF